MTQLKKKILTRKKLQETEFAILGTLFF